MTACDRITALLHRAGHPLMFVANPELHTVKPVIHESLEACVEAIVTDRQRDNVDTIELLATALENVLNERDQLLKDLEHTVTRHRSCDFCAHKPYETLDCYKCMTDNRWTWRGVLDKEETP